MVVVGSKRMVRYDDTASDEPVRIYDRGMEFTTPANFGEYQLTYRSGDVVIPRIDVAEPLGLELADFAQCRSARVASRARTPQLGLEIVRRASEARRGSRSSRQRRSPISLDGRAGRQRAAGVSPTAPRRCASAWSTTRTSTSTRASSARRAPWPSGATRWIWSASARLRRAARRRGEIRVHGVLRAKAGGGAAQLPERLRALLRYGALRRVTALDARAPLRRRRGAQHARLPHLLRRSRPKLRGRR